MAVTKQQLAQWSREFAAKNPDKVSGAGSTAQNTTTKKSSVTKEQLSQWSREFDKKEAQRQAEQEQNTRDKALQQYTERHISDMGEVDARNEPSQAASPTATENISGRKENLSPFPSADAARERSSPDRGNGDDRGQWPKQGGAVGAAASGMQAAAQQTLGAATRAQSALLKGSPTERALDMGQKWGVPAKSGNVLENVGSGAMAYGSGRAQELRASFAKDSVPDEFDRINQWLDTGDNKNLADAVRRVDNTHGAYTDADLIKKGGWTQAQIDEARKMNAALDAIPAWQRGVRRAANAIGGIGDTVAAAPVLGAEYGVQAGKNIDATLKNWKQVEQEVKGDEHAQSLFDLLTDVDMDYNPTWPESRNRELISMGYNSKEIREMRQRLAGLEVSDGIDKNQSVGYQLYDRGQQLTAAAQSGLSPAQKAVTGAVTSAAENLAVAGVNPAAVLPILSAQGAAEAMGQSAEKGESAGKALGGGLAKFGAGWAINSVGAADLAKTMGSDYAKDTLAGQIADWVQGLAGSSELAKRYPAVAAAISGGIDNSMQAFAETYADMAIDAALGDSEAAKNLFSKDTFLTALESGLSGGASGALGGAVGSGLAKMNDGDASLLGQAEYYDRLDRMERAAARQKEWEARAAEPSQSATDSSADRALDGQDLSVADATAPLKRGATGVPGSSQLDAGSSMGRKMAGAATEDGGSGPAQQTLGAATRAQSATGVPGSSQLDAGSAAGREMAGLATEGSGSVNETAAKSENPAVRQFAEVAARDSLTGKTIGLFTPNAENRENRAAFEQAYGVTLPDTAGATRRMLQEIAAQQNVKSEAAPAAQSAELPGEAVDVPQTVQDTPAEIADVVPEMAAPGNVREATAAAAETDSYENAPLRETLGLRPEAPKTQREAEVQRALEGWRVTDKAAETISKNMPDRVDADRYAAAASPLYRLGRKGAATFAQALELAGSMSGTAADINYILSTDAGRTALEIAYTQGKSERMLYAEKMAGLGGTLGSESTSGRGEVYAKAEAWQEKQAQRNAIAIETARQQRDEDVAVAKALAEKRVQKAREGRKADELKRSIRNNAAQLNQMVLRPKPGKYVQKSLIVQAAEVAKLADMAVLNNNAVAKLTALQDSIRRSGEMDAGIHTDWENSGVEKLIQTLRDDMNASKQAKLDRLRQQLEEAKALPDGDKAEQLRDRLRQRIRETENRTYLPMTVDQLRMLKAITASTLHIIRTENKTLTLARAEEVDSMAMKAAREVLNSEGNGFGEKFEKAKGAMNRYQLDMLGGTRMFRRLGGYTKNGQMEKLGQMLNDGQRRQTEILVEGESLFANVTGKEHLKEVEAFAGPGAELVDIGLKDSKGNAVPLNHAQLCSLYMLLRNEDSRHHLMTGGLTLPDAAQYAKGNIERAYQRSQTVMLGTLVNADGVPMADTILQTVQGAMTDYDRAWCEDMKDFFGRYTTNLINETSMKLLGYDRATVKNYYPIAVDRSTLATEIEGVKMDATIEGRGFLKERVKSDKPILLEECQNVVKRSLRDTAAYAGLAAPIRDVQRVLNSTVETAEGVGVLKDKIIGEKWGRETVSYINDLLTDLQTRQRHRSSTMSRALDRMRGNYAGAILTVNPGVAIAQAASLPTAGAVLGADTMAAVLPFVKNFSGKQRAALEAEIRQHGDALLQYRLRGTKRGEMSSIGAHKNLVAKASEAMPAVTGWITGMDEITVAALWEGSKRYVERHAAEFGLTEENLSAAQSADGGAARSSPTEGSQESRNSEAYWEAVNKMYQRVIEETQPNYTTMQRAGIQRSDNEFVKTLTMFTTQRFQNYGILADAVGDYKAQKARYAADQSAENKAEVQRAGQSLRRAAASQVVQTAVFALMKIGADFLLHRWDKEQDENGDITAASVGKRFFDLYTESAAGNFLYGAEIYSVISNAASGADYDVVSATNISAVNDLFAAFTKTAKLLRTDTNEMSEEELAAHHQKLNKAVLKDIQCGLELYGVPAANIRKVMQAFEGYWEDAQAIGRGEGFSFSSAPSSATGQYDRLYNAIQSGDSEEVAAAMKKLEQMGKTDKVDSELARRLKQYDADVLAAAEARNAGKTRAEEKARKAVFEKLREGLGVAPATDRAKGKADAARRAQLIDVVNKAVDGKADELLAGSKDGSVYDALLDEVENGRAKDVQAEINRLLTAGKDKGNIKSKITEAVKEEYLAGSDRDREKLEKKLLALEDADENPLYEEKDFAQWVNQADKKAEKAKDERNWWEGVK